MSALLAFALQVAAQTVPASPESDQAAVNAIADSCRAARNWLVLRDNELIFRGDLYNDQSKVECVLRKMSALVTRTNRGLPGNARASEEK